MLVFISDRGAPRLCMAEDLHSLSVRAETGSTDWDALARVLGVAGEVSGGHAWLDIAWLRELAGERGPAWEGGFSGMVAYARDHGWLSADGNRVRAHVEWRSASGD